MIVIILFCETIRSYVSMGVWMLGFVVSASCIVVAVKGMREEQKERREYPSSSFMSHEAMNRCLIPLK
jgi:hypothetical protein